MMLSMIIIIFLIYLEYLGRHVYTCCFKVVFSSHVHLYSTVSQLYEEMHHIDQNLLEEKSSNKRKWFANSKSLY